ncbi:hypothetical protein ACGFI5_28885 [Micromonospora tulbaghiae]|uniref:hypothetical protein n=1 Tax=Micromonospora tulbaghiae TaxID=479978 RepID=UPI0029C40CF2|nr:hypothetical protein [Micromonospora tulbaghiae]MDX5460973.1 hypothetical protein [Micromonospora tulbaghiae]
MRQWLQSKGREVTYPWEASSLPSVTAIPGAARHRRDQGRTGQVRREQARREQARREQVRREQAPREQARRTPGAGVPTDQRAGSDNSA